MLMLDTATLRELAQNRSSRFAVFYDSPAFNALLQSEGFALPVAVRGDEVIWGHTVISATPKSQLPAVEGSWTDADAVLLALRLEDRSGGYSYREQEALAALVGDLGIEEKLDEISRAVSGNTGFFKKIGAFSNLSSRLKESVRAGRIDVKTAGRIKRLPDEVVKKASQAQLTHSEVRIFLVALQEIAYRDSLENEELAAFTERLLSAERPMDELHKQRSPGLSDLQARFDRVVQEKLSGTGVTLTPPQFFEGDAYRITFDFSGKNQLERRLAVLKNLEESCDELEDLL